MKSTLGSKVSMVRRGDIATGAVLEELIITIVSQFKNNNKDNKGKIFITSADIKNKIQTMPIFSGFILDNIIKYNANDLGNVVYVDRIISTDSLLYLITSVSKFLKFSKDGIGLLNYIVFKTYCEILRVSMAINKYAKK